MTPCIVSLLRAALASSGCSNVPTADLDQHASIELEFPNIPNIVVDRSEYDAVVLFCNLDAKLGRLRALPTTSILDIVATKATWARYHAISLLEEDGSLYLTAVVADHCLQDGEGFSIALDGFYQRVCALCGVAPQ